MIFEVNVFGAHCKGCKKPLDKADFVGGKFYLKAGNDGILRASTGYIDLYHAGCFPK